MDFKKRVSTSIQQQSLKGLFQVVSTFHPRWAARMGVELFLRPRRHPRPGWESDVLMSAELIEMPSNLAVWRIGQSKRRALLVHGWDGRGSQLGKLIPSLVEAGFEVILFDFPAHGDSPGRTTHVGEWVKTLHEIATAVGPIEVVIAHSLGGSASVIALEASPGFRPQKMVTIAAPNYFPDLFDQFCSMVGLQGRATTHFNRQIQKRTSVNARVSFPSAVLSQIKIPTLVIHDPEDEAVSFEQAVQISMAGPHVQLVKVENCGHRRILKNKDVIDEIVKFIDGVDA